MKYEIGDIVYIKDMNSMLHDEKLDIIDDMLEYIGKKATICNSDGYSYKIKIDDIGIPFMWYDHCFCTRKLKLERLLGC